MVTIPSRRGEAGLRSRHVVTDITRSLVGAKVHPADVKTAMQQLEIIRSNTDAVAPSVGNNTALW